MHQENAMKLSQQFRGYVERRIFPLLPPQIDGSVQGPFMLGTDHLLGTASYHLVYPFTRAGNVYKLNVFISPNGDMYLVEMELHRHNPDSPYSAPGVQYSFSLIESVQEFTQDLESLNIEQNVKNVLRKSA
jgi:hypothetical protein